MSKSFTVVLGGSHGLASKRILKVTGPPNERHTPRMLDSAVEITLIRRSPSGSIFPRHFYNICAAVRHSFTHSGLVIYWVSVITFTI